jgi:hypothetical protein
MRRVRYKQFCCDPECMGMVSETTIRPHVRRCTNCVGTSARAVAFRIRQHAREAICPTAHVRALTATADSSAYDGPTRIVREIQNVMPTVIGMNCSDRTSPPLASPPPTSVP